ncbi:MAG: hypothetical protein IKP77_03480 [Acholeplasmatales bacterium]|nr:hypothetical protein [Acholeplasmatales bacterium]
MENILFVIKENKKSNIVGILKTNSSLKFIKDYLMDGKTIDDLLDVISVVDNDASYMEINKITPNKVDLKAAGSANVNVIFINKNRTIDDKL